MMASSEVDGILAAGMHFSRPVGCKQQDELQHRSHFKYNRKMGLMAQLEALMIFFRACLQTSATFPLQVINYPRLSPVTSMAN